MAKQQLNDMALGVRELSKHLASMGIHMRIKAVFVLTKQGDAGLVEYTRVLAEWLLREGYMVYVEDALKGGKRFKAAGILYLMFMRPIEAPPSSSSQAQVPSHIPAGLR